MYQQHWSIWTWQPWGGVFRLIWRLLMRVLIRWFQTFCWQHPYFLQWWHWPFYRWGPWWMQRRLFWVIFQNLRHCLFSSIFLQHRNSFLPRVFLRVLLVQLWIWRHRFLRIWWVRMPSILFLIRRKLIQLLVWLRDLPYLLINRWRWWHWPYQRL